MVMSVMGEIFHEVKDLNFPEKIEIFHRIKYSTISRMKRSLFVLYNLKNENLWRSLQSLANEKSNLSNTAWTLAYFAYARIRYTRTAHFAACIGRRVEKRAECNGK